MGRPTTIVVNDCEVMHRPGGGGIGERWYVRPFVGADAYHGATLAEACDAARDGLAERVSLLAMMEAAAPQLVEAIAPFEPEL
jgi:hypothetical protein